MYILEQSVVKVNETDFPIDTNHFLCGGSFLMNKTHTNTQTATVEPSKYLFKSGIYNYFLTKCIIRLNVSPISCTIGRITCACDITSNQWMLPTSRPPRKDACFQFLIRSIARTPPLFHNSLLISAECRHERVLDASQFLEESLERPSRKKYIIFIQTG